MRAIGVDPGWANCGVAVVVDDRLVYTTTLHPPPEPRYREWPAKCVWVALAVGKVAEAYGIERAGIESVQWHGRRTGTIRLALLAGLIWGVLAARGIETMLVVPSIVKRTSLPRRYASSWAGDSHERDAAVLAWLAAGRRLRPRLSRVVVSSDSSGPWSPKPRATRRRVMRRRPGGWTRLGAGGRGRSGR